MFFKHIKIISHKLDILCQFMSHWLCISSRYLRLHQQLVIPSVTYTCTHAFQRTCLYIVDMPSTEPLQPENKISRWVCASFLARVLFQCLMAGEGERSPLGLLYNNFKNHLWPNPIPKVLPSPSLHHGNPTYTISSHEHLNYNCAHVHSFMKLFIISHFQAFFCANSLGPLDKGRFFYIFIICFLSHYPDQFNHSFYWTIHFLWCLNVFSEKC